MTISIFEPNFAPTAALAVNVSAAVSSSASAAAAQLGPFRGLYINTSTSFTMVQIDNTSVSFNDVPKGTTLWLAGKYVNVLATATAAYALK